MSRFRTLKMNSISLLHCLTMIFLTGCWDQIEVNDIALIMATSVDKSTKNNIELSVQVYIPKPPGGGQQEGMTSGSGGGQTFVKSAKGSTIADAMSRLQEQLPRRIFLGQNEVLIIGEELAKKGISDEIDFWMRHTEPRERADVFVSKGKAKKVLETIPELEQDTAKQLQELVKTQIGVKVTVKDLSQMLASESRAAVLPWVESNKSSTGENEIPFITGVSVFKGDQMVGKLNDKVTRGILWPRNEMKSGVITVSLKDDKGFVSLNLLRSHNKLIPNIKNGKWSITVKTDTDLEIIQNTTNLNLLNPKSIKEIERRVVQQIEKREKLAFSEAQKKMNADIFHFAETFQREYPRIWKRKKRDWDTIFPEVEVLFDTKVDIKRTGLASKKMR